jgi:hypothetical protein
MLAHKIKKWFEEATRLAPFEDELKRAVLRDNSRVQFFISGLTQQLEQAESINVKRGKFIKEKTYQEFVYSMTTLFLTGIKREAERRYESDLAKLARKAEADKIKEFDQVIAGKAEGEFADAGVITNDKIDAQREKYLEEKTKAESAR